MASLYIHIPFCERKCPYCDFYSVANTGLMEEFLAALRGEISLRAGSADRTVFETVFFGGGTPSLLEPRQLDAILTSLRATFAITPDAEVTLEANPGTVSRDTLRAFRSAGINRLSIGIQSFHDHELKFLGRIHDGAEALRCYEHGRAAGFDNIGMDLIYSIPGQTLDRWEDTLRTTLTLEPQHLAAYSLTVEDETPLGRMVEAGAVRTNSAHVEAEMYERAMELLGAHGYEHYEVSNYALPGFCCRHNRNYWSHEQYLGFGPSAHSFWKEGGARTGRRWWNMGDLSAYRARLNGGSLPVASEEDVGTREMIQERIFLGLRSSGLDLTRLTADLEYDLEARQGDRIRWLIEEGLGILDGGIVRLTSKGYLLCDEICRRLLP